MVAVTAYRPGVVAVTVYMAGVVPVTAYMAGMVAVTAYMDGGRPVGGASDRLHGRGAASLFPTPSVPPGLAPACLQCAN